MMRGVVQKSQSRWRYWRDLPYEVLLVVEAEDMAVVMDRESMVAVRKVMGSIFGVGLRSRVSARWCMTNGARAVQHEDVMNAVWPPSRHDMEQVRAVLGKRRNCLTDDEKLLLRRRRDMIIFRYDPLLTVSPITIVFTRMTIGADNDATHVMMPTGHNTLTDALTNLILSCLLFLKLVMFNYKNHSYHFSSQAGDIVTAHDAVTNAEINICKNLCSNIR